MVAAAATVAVVKLQTKALQLPALDRDRGHLDAVSWLVSWRCIDEGGLASFVPTCALLSF